MLKRGFVSLSLTRDCEDSSARVVVESERACQGISAHLDDSASLISGTATDENVHQSGHVERL